MRKITLTALGLLFILSASAQYLYSVTDGSDPKDLSYTFSLYNTSNGKLPQGVSDMARGVAVDSMGRIWMGTDNGLVCREKENVKKFNYTNSPLVNTPYDRELTYTIFSIIADRDNGVWINQGWDLFRVKDDEWTRFDTLNSPVY